MSESFQPELLSAYLDGELSAQEQAFVENMLREQPALQAQLSRLGELSSKVQNLPRLKAPEELRQSVLAEIARRAESSATERSNGVAPLKLPRGTSWRAPLMWLTPIAAVLTVGALLSLIDKQDEGRVADVRVEATSQAPALADRENDDRIALTDHPMSADKSAKPWMSIDRSTSEESIASNGSVMPQTTGLASDFKIAGDSQLAVNDSTFPQVALLSEDLEDKLKEFDEVPSPGEELAFAEMRGKTPVVVGFTVVDVKTTLDSVELLLKKQSVVPVIETETVTSEDKKLGYTIVAFDLPEPELEDVLNRVEAYQAVRYVSLFEVTNKSQQASAINEANSESELAPPAPQGQVGQELDNNRREFASGAISRAAVRQQGETGLQFNAPIQPHLQTFKFQLDVDPELELIAVRQQQLQSSPAEPALPASQSGGSGGSQKITSAAQSAVPPPRSAAIAEPSAPISRNGPRENLEQASRRPEPQAKGEGLRAARSGPESTPAAQGDVQVRESERRIRAVLLLKQLDE